MNFMKTWKNLCLLCFKKMFEIFADTYQLPLKNHHFIKKTKNNTNNSYKTYKKVQILIYFKYKMQI